MQKKNVLDVQYGGKYGFGCTITGKIMYGHMSYMGVFDWIKIIGV